MLIPKLKEKHRMRYQWFWIIISLLFVLINYYEVLFLLQQHFRICLCCQCINPVSYNPSSFSGLRHQSCHLNATILSHAVSGQSPDAQEEPCFNLGPSAQPSSPSALTLWFLNTAQFFDHNLLRSLSSQMWLEDTVGSQPCPWISFSRYSVNTVE